MTRSKSALSLILVMICLFAAASIVYGMVFNGGNIFGINIGSGMNNSQSQTPPRS